MHDIKLFGIGLLSVLAGKARHHQLEQAACLFLSGQLGQAQLKLAQSSRLLCSCHLCELLASMRPLALPSELLNLHARPTAWHHQPQRMLVAELTRCPWTYVMLCKVSCRCLGGGELRQSIYSRPLDLEERACLAVGYGDLAM